VNYVITVLGLTLDVLYI